MQAVRLVLLVTYVCLAGAALPLPKYVKPCSRSDPKFNDCARKHAQQVLAYPGLEKGDQKYRIPPLSPLQISEIKVSQGSGLDLTVRNAKVYGLLGARVDSTEFDLQKQHLRFQLTFPLLSLLGQYEVQGRILVLPITGRGDINITNVDSVVTFEADYSLEPIEGKLHVVTKNGKARLEPARTYTQLTNLFNGDKLLGKQMNDFMNENWREMNEELAPSFNEVTSGLITSIINNVASLVPYDVAFPEKLPAT